METLTILDISASIIIAYCFLLPSFNEWPKSEQGQFTNAPNCYISEQRYFLFGSIYVASYLLFAFAISQIPELSTLLNNFIDKYDIANSSAGQTEALNNAKEIADASTNAEKPGSEKAKSNLDNFSLTASIILLEGGIKMAPRLQTLDEKWRGHLLALARIPKDVLNLKFSIFTAMEHGLSNKKHIQNILEHLNMRHPKAHWLDFDLINSGLDTQGEIRLLLLKNAYLAQANRAFDLSLSDQQDLIKTDELINTTVTALPQLDLETDPGAFYQGKLELTNNLKMLTETLARNAVKTHSDRASQIVRIKQLGLDLEYVDQKDLNGHLLKPAITVIIGILALNLIIVCVGFWLFDKFGVNPLPNKEKWFTFSLAARWIVGAWISLIVAIFFGLFFRETMNNSSGGNSLMGYFSAFCFAFLGSSLYFLGASKVGDSSKLSITHFWLAIAFASMAIVTMYSFTKDVFDQREADKNARAIALVYGLLVGILHLFIIVSKDPLPEQIDIFARGALGFLRGFFVAYLVSYIIMDFHMRKSFDGRRKYPRMFYHKLITGQYNEIQTPMLVKNLSFGGALVRFPENKVPESGLPIVMDFDFASISGDVIRTEQNLAHIRFDPDSPGLNTLKEKMQDAIELHYELAAA